MNKTKQPDPVNEPVKQPALETQPTPPDNLFADFPDGDVSASDFLTPQFLWNVLRSSGQEMGDFLRLIQPYEGAYPFDAEKDFRVAPGVGDVGSLFGQVVGEFGKQIGRQTVAQGLLDAGLRDEYKAFIEMPAEAMPVVETLIGYYKDRYDFSDPQVRARFDELLYTEPAAVLADLIEVASLFVSGGAGVGTKALRMGLKHSKVARFMDRVATSPVAKFVNKKPVRKTRQITKDVTSVVSGDLSLPVEWATKGFLSAVNNRMLARTGRSLSDMLSLRDALIKLKGHAGFDFDWKEKLPIIERHDQKLRELHDSILDLFGVSSEQFDAAFRKFGAMIPDKDTTFDEIFDWAADVAEYDPDLQKLVLFGRKIREINQQFEIFLNHLDNLDMEIRIADLQRALAEGYIDPIHIDLSLTKQFLLNLSLHENVWTDFLDDLGQSLRERGNTQEVVRNFMSNISDPLDAEIADALQQVITKDITDLLTYTQGDLGLNFSDATPIGIDYQQLLDQLEQGADLDALTPYLDALEQDGFGTLLTDLSDINAVRNASQGRLDALLTASVREVLNPVTVNPASFNDAVETLFPADVPIDTINTVKTALGGDDALAWQFVQRQVLRNMWEEADVPLSGRTGDKTVKNPLERSQYNGDQLRAILGSIYFANLDKMNADIEAFRNAIQTHEIKSADLRFIRTGEWTDTLQQFYHMGEGIPFSSERPTSLISGAMRGLKQAAKQWKVEDLYNRFADYVDDTSVGRTRFAWLLERIAAEAHKKGTLLALYIGREALQVQDESR